MYKPAASIENEVEVLNVDVMLEHPCVTMEVGVMKSTIKHDMARLRCFVRDAFWKQILIGYFSSTLIY